VPLLLPAATLAQVSGLDALQLAMLAFCCANTVIAYGCFAEALEHWEVSRVSAVVTVAPLVTLAGMHAASGLWPDRLAAEGLTWPSVVGALVVVAGAMTTAIAARTVSGGPEPPNQPSA
jgi:drug/metabolite transporter (DMT)-like permease